MSSMIRRVKENDVEAITGLVYELADYEESLEHCTVKPEQIAAALFGRAPSVFAECRLHFVVDVPVLGGHPSRRRRTEKQQQDRYHDKSEQRTVQRLMRVGEQRPDDRQQEELHDKCDGSRPTLTRHQRHTRSPDGHPDHCEPSGCSVAVRGGILDAADSADK